MTNHDKRLLERYPGGSRESEAREVLARSAHAAILPSNHSPMQDAVIAAMLEFAALSTPVQSAVSTFHETGDPLKVREMCAAFLDRHAARIAAYEGPIIGRYVASLLRADADAIRRLDVTKGEEG